VRAGGYTPLKLQGVFGALAGQVIVAGLGGVIYAFYLKRRDRRDVAQITSTSLLDGRGWSLIIPGVLAATILFVALLWPTLSTNYRGFPPGAAHVIASIEMLISFSVCGFGIMFFYSLLSRPAHAMTEGGTATRDGPIGWSPPVRCAWNWRRCRTCSWQHFAPAFSDGHIQLRRASIWRTEGAENHADSSGRRILPGLKKPH